MEEQKTILAGGDGNVGETQVVGIEGERAAAQTDTAAPAADFSGIIDKDGFFSENWRQALPEDIRGESCLDSIKNISTMAKSFVSAQKMVGKNKISLPGENSTEEEWGAFYSALGRPEKAESYSLDGVEIPDGISLNEDSVTAFKEFCFSNGMSQKVFEQAVAWDIKRSEEAREAQIRAYNQEYDETLSKLKAQYGEDLDARISQVDKALTTFGIKDIFVERGLTNNYRIFEALANIGASISESKLKGGAVQATFTTPKQQLDDLYADRSGPLYDPNHPKHEQAVAEAKRLISLINQQQ
jgi:hypothetical protein